MRKAKTWRRYGLMLQKNNILVTEFLSKLSKKLTSKLKTY